MCNICYRITIINKIYSICNRNIIYEINNIYIINEIYKIYAINMICFRSNTCKDIRAVDRLANQIADPILIVNWFRSYHPVIVSG